MRFLKNEANVYGTWYSTVVQGLSSFIAVGG